jgi:transcriptional regulator with XRE-family HTH domain
MLGYFCDVIIYNRNLMNLAEKIELIIKRKQLSSSQFADILGIPRSSISHILSGRNKPSLDVVQKILTAFPEISAEELLFEDRSLQVATAVKTQMASNPPMPTLFDSPAPSPSESIKNNLPEPTIVRSNLRRNRQEAKNVNLLNENSIAPQTFAPHLTKHIERVIIFYSDGSFSESKPLA